MIVPESTRSGRLPTREFVSSVFVSEELVLFVIVASSCEIPMNIYIR